MRNNIPFNNLIMCFTTFLVINCRRNCKGTVCWRSYAKRPSSRRWKSSKAKIPGSIGSLHALRMCTNCKRRRFWWILLPMSWFTLWWIRKNKKRSSTPQPWSPLLWISRRKSDGRWLIVDTIDLYYKGYIDFNPLAMKYHILIHF